MDNQLDVLNRSILQADSIISKSYMEQLNRYSVIPISAELSKTPLSLMSKLVKINSISYTKNERNIDKLSNIYNVLMDSTSSIIYIITSDGEKSDFFLGVRDANPIIASANGHSLKSAFLGNFPGSDLQDVQSEEEILEKAFHNQYNSNNYVVSVSGIAALKNEQQTEFIQGMENLMDSMKGQKFSAIFISDAVSRSQLKTMQQGYENLYSQLSPFATTDVNIGYNENHSISDSLTEGFSKGLTESLSESQSTSLTHSKSSGSAESKGRNVLASTWVSLVGGKTGSSTNENLSDGFTDGKQTSQQHGSQETTNKQETKSETSGTGKSRSMQTKLQNKTVMGLLENIDAILKRMKTCEDLGTWNCAAYFIAEDKKTATIAASTYKSLMRGKNSSVEPSFINIWEDDDDTDSNEMVIAYLKKLTHPLFSVELQNYSGNEGGSNILRTIVNPGSLVSGSELAIQLGLPKKSLQGLPVMEFAAFGRDVIKHSKGSQADTIRLGNIYHMGACGSLPVEIDLNSLTMHTFITGTTGSGKSNTVYHLLDELLKKNINFLVIEPAKGEYKDVFGGYPGVKVFGTNKNETEVLKINPFVFPKNIGIKSHIEKLLEIFNACWSMYAAMPSILKQALVACYEEKGWDMDDSVNYDGDIYPDFSDLLRVLPDLISKSDFSEEVKSNYVGALVERVRELTVGIAQTMFLDGQVDDRLLFDQSCIIDISQDLSAETKSLVMGLLVMKMREYRYSRKEKNQMNRELSHVTVLEEAHNLLRKTSFTQSQEGANVQGKSVEMLSNAIAEMRSVGEGFIIVDQSPSKLDDSAIGNTNTKIIHRITTEYDYMLVGKSANISNEQIVEIPKLRDGVAAVYQNNWMQPVLCQMPRFTNMKPLVYECPLSKKQISRIMYGDMIQLLLLNKYGTSFNNEKKFTTTYICDMIGYLEVHKPMNYEIIKSNLNEFIQHQTMELWDESRTETIGDIIYGLLPSDDIFQKLIDVKTIQELTDKLLSNIRRYLELSHIRVIEYSIGQLLLAVKCKNNPEYIAVLKEYIRYMKGKC